MDFQQLDHIVLTITSLTQAKVFYAKLGLDIESFGSGPDKRYFASIGQQKLNFQLVDKPYPPVAQAPTPGSADFCLITNTPTTQVMTELRQKQIEVVAGPVLRQGALGQMKSVYVRDPDENLIEIAHYITE